MNLLVSALCNYRQNLIPGQAHIRKLCPTSNGQQRLIDNVEIHEARVQPLGFPGMHAGRV